MNTNGLAKHYDLLTPWERLPLTVAALARGDDVEVERLGRSAPKLGIRVANYWGLIDGLNCLAMTYMLRQFDAAMILGYALGLLGPKLVAHKRTSKQENLLWRAAQTRAYRFVVSADGWKMFCAPTAKASPVKPGHASADHAQNPII